MGDLTSDYGVDYIVIHSIIKPDPTADITEIPLK